MKNTISETKNSLERLSSKHDQVEERINKYKDKSFVLLSKRSKNKKTARTVKEVKDLWDTCMHYGSPEGKERQRKRIYLKK